MSRLIVLLLLLAFTAPAFAADQGFYLGVVGGTSDQDDISFYPVRLAFKDGYMAGAAMGYDYGFVKTELELSRRSNDLGAMSVFGAHFPGSGKVSLTALLLNVYAEYDNRTPLVPYAGLGVGWGVLDLDNVSSAGGTVELTDDDGAVVQVMFGLGYKVTDRWRFNLDYRGASVSIGTGGRDDSADDDYFSSSIALGVNYYF